jgi:hypothetical protein
MLGSIYFWATCMWTSPRTASGVANPSILTHGWPGAGRYSVHGRVIHLVAAIHIESALHLDAGGNVQCLSEALVVHRCRASIRMRVARQSG